MISFEGMTEEQEAGLQNDIRKTNKESFAGMQTAELVSVFVPMVSREADAEIKRLIKFFSSSLYDLIKRLKFQ